MNIIYIWRCNMMDEKSCGAVLFTGNKNRQYVLVKSATNGYWGLPKGHVEHNETEKETALREIMEETGVTAEIIEGFREQIEYIMPNGIRKQVIFFIAEYANQKIEINQYEVSDVLITTIDKSLEVLTNDDVKNVLLKADNWINFRI